MDELPERGRLLKQEGSLCICRGRERGVLVLVKRPAAARGIKLLVSGS